MAAPTVEGLVLTHGAGGDRDQHSLVAIAEGLAPLPVERINFPYRNQGRRPPDRAPKLLAFLHEEIPAIATRLGADPGRLVLGGRSMGGRMFSMAVAEGMPAAGLVLLSYPLHPPKKPENLRTGHFGAIEVPCLFISGDRDPFGTPEEFDHHLAAIKGPVSTVWLEGERHDPKKADAEIVAAVASWLKTL
ncbi:MAG: dienelactone hydrolase [Acidimicrobiia bacterium]|nr:dienelactone hydrolase [Acidimicrobiia bacterium]